MSTAARARRAREAEPTAPRRSVLLAMDFYLRPVHEGIVRYARQAGWALDQRMCHSHVLPSDWRGDGVLVCAHERRISIALRRLDRPVVAVVSSPTGLGCPCAAMDDAAAGRLAAAHLLDRGFRRLAFFQPGAHPAVLGRREGFRQTVLGAEREFHLLDWSARYARSGERGLNRWLATRLKRLRPPVGVMASSDAWAVKVIHACHAAGLRVPQDVAVIGVDNDPMYGSVAPIPLSSVDNSLEQVGYEGARLLNAVMSSGPGQESLSIPPAGVVTRRSTDTLAVEDPSLARAMGYVLDHSHRPVRVAELAREARVSTRWLLEQFKREFGRTPVQMLAQVRLERACRLLRQTRDKVEIISRRCGFSSSKYMNSVFQRHVGISPRSYRKAHRGS